MFLFVPASCFGATTAPKPAETSRRATVKLELCKSFVVSRNLSCAFQTTQNKSPSSHIVRGSQLRQASGSSDVWDCKHLVRPDPSEEHIVAKARNTRNAKKSAKSAVESSSSFTAGEDPDAGDIVERYEQLGDEQGHSEIQSKRQNSNLRAQRDNGFGDSEAAHIPGGNVVNDASNISNDKSSAELDVGQTDLDDQSGIGEVQRKSPSRSRAATIPNKKSTSPTSRRKTPNKEYSEVKAAHTASAERKESTKRKSKKTVSVPEETGDGSASSTRRRRGRPRKPRSGTQEQAAQLQAVDKDPSKSIDAEGGRGSMKGKKLSKAVSQKLLNSRQSTNFSEERSTNYDRQPSVQASDNVREIDTQSTKSNASAISDGITTENEDRGGLTSRTATFHGDYKDKTFAREVLSPQQPTFDDGLADRAPLHEEEHAAAATKDKSEPISHEEERNLNDFIPTAESDGGPKLQSKPPAEQLVVKETSFRDGRYGTCFNCGHSVVIPGLAQFYCENCGWIRRPIETKSIIPGHHD